MASHFLIINHESYDSSTVFGIFGTFLEARDLIEAEVARGSYSSAATNAEIEEWDGDALVRIHSRSYVSPNVWKIDGS